MGEIQPMLLIFSMSYDISLPSNLSKLLGINGQNLSETSVLTGDKQPLCDKTVHILHGLNNFRQPVLVEDDKFGK